MSSLTYQMLTILCPQGLWYKDTISHAQRGVKLCLRQFGGLFTWMNYVQIRRGKSAVFGRISPLLRQLPKGGQGGNLSIFPLYVK